jgi:hypothetical protein
MEKESEEIEKRMLEMEPVLLRLKEKALKLRKEQRTKDQVTIAIEHMIASPRLMKQFTEAMRKSHER